MNTAISVFCLKKEKICKRWLNTTNLISMAHSIHSCKDAERLVKISRDNIPVGRRSPGCPKRRWSNLIID